MKNLLDLPAELVQAILLSLDPESFYICLQTSKSFREHALASKSLLRDQLSRVPGPALLPSHVADNAAGLLKEFGKWAARDLKTGASWIADVQTWRFDSWPDLKNCTFLPNFGGHLDGDPESSQKLAFLEVLKYEPTINLYVAEPDRNGNLYPQITHVISMDSIPQLPQPEESDSPLTHEILKIATSIPKGSSTHSLAVLYRAKPATTTSHEVVEWAKIAVFELDVAFGPIVKHIVDCTTALYANIAAAMALRGLNPSVVYRHKRDDSYMVTTYRVGSKSESEGTQVLSPFSFIYTSPVHCHPDTTPHLSPPQHTHTDNLPS